MIDTGAVAANAGSWSIQSRIIKVGANSQKCITKIISDNTLIVDSANYILSSETETAAILIVSTGTAPSNDDITQEGLLIKWFDY